MAEIEDPGAIDLPSSCFFAAKPVDAADYLSDTRYSPGITLTALKPGDKHPTTMTLPPQGVSSRTH